MRHAFPKCVYANGVIHIVWHDNRTNPGGEDFDVYYNTIDPDTGTPIGEKIVIATGGVYEGFASIDVDAEGDPHVAYQQMNATMQIFHKEMTGADFGSEHLVALESAFQPSIDCGISPDEVFIAYFDYSDGSFSDVHLAISTNGGLGFVPTKISSSETDYQIHPVVKQAANGDLYVAWAEEGFIDIDGEPGPDDLNGDGTIDQNDAVPHRSYFRQKMGPAWQFPIQLATGADATAFPQLAVGEDKFVHVAFMKWTVDQVYDNYDIFYRHSLPFN